MPKTFNRVGKFLKLYKMKKVTKKLSLNKETVSNLDKTEMTAINGGTWWLIDVFTELSVWCGAGNQSTSCGGVETCDGPGSCGPCNNGRVKCSDEN